MLWLEIDVAKGPRSRAGNRFGLLVEPRIKSVFFILALICCRGVVDQAHLQTATEHLLKCEFVEAKGAAGDVLTGSGSDEARISALLIQSVAARRLGETELADVILEELRATSARAEVDRLVAELERAIDCGGDALGASPGSYASVRSCPSEPLASVSDVPACPAWGTAASTG